MFKTAYALHDTMPRITWTTITAVLVKEGYVEYDRELGAAKCKICGEEMEIPEGRFKAYSIIYKHFKEKHPEVIEQVKEKLTNAKGNLAIT